jgi:transcriptional regulator with XRE-family HTH domain
MDLKERFGRLVAANRKRKAWTQADLAENADLSEDMVARIEAGTTGTSFASIERLAAALDLDPSELFSSHANKSRQRKALLDVASSLSTLSDDELAWVAELTRVALRRPR